MTRSAAQILELLQGLLAESYASQPGVDFTKVSATFKPDNAQFVLTIPNGQTFKISAEEL